MGLHVVMSGKVSDAVNFVIDHIGNQVIELRKTLCNGFGVSRVHMVG